MKLRPIFARLHRYTGLAIAVFLAIAGLTGSVIVFAHELDEWLNPDLFRVSAHGAALAPTALADSVERADPHVRVRSLPLRIEPNHSIHMWIEPRIDPATSKPFAISHDQVFVNPTTGAILGARRWGDCCFERKNLINFIYVMHYSLHLPTNVGMLLMGTVAIIWAVDAFVGMYLTFPRARPFFAKWKASWKIKRGAGRYRLNFDLHRAAGLWFWGVLLTLAVSAVSLNLGRQVFLPIVSLVSPVTPDIFERRKPIPNGQTTIPKFSREQIIAIAAREANQRGWTRPMEAINYVSSFGIYRVGFGERGAPGLGLSYLFFDGNDRRVIDARVAGEGTAGDVFYKMQFPLHSGQIAGLPTRILIFLTGIAVAMLSITGVIIWLRKTGWLINPKRTKAPTIGAFVKTREA